MHYFSLSVSSVTDLISCHIVYHVSLFIEWTQNTVYLFLIVVNHVLLSFACFRLFGGYPGCLRNHISVASKSFLILFFTFQDSLPYTEATSICCYSLTFCESNLLHKIHFIIWNAVFPWPVLLSVSVMLQPWDIMIVPKYMNL